MWKVVFTGVLLAVLWSGGARADSLNGDVRAWRLAHEKEIVANLADLVRLRSVAADPAGLAATAAWLEGELKRRGFDAKQLSGGTNSASAVFGALDTPGAKRTVVYYAHYDGQPVTPSEWRSDPFEPVMRNGGGADAADVDWRKAKAPLDPEWRLFGRAVSDDKSSIIAFLAAFDALKAMKRKPSVNIRVFWEGEEEAGSAHLEKILRANRELLAADLWLIGDGPVHQSRKRMIYFGARGVMDLEATIYGPLRALHDGHYGNWVPNPAARTAQFISDLRGPDGRLRVPGLARVVRPVSAAERAAIKRLPPVEKDLKRGFGIAGGESNEGLIASIMRPAMNVRGLRAGQVGDAATNSIPVDATISIDFRLVPDLTPQGVRRAVEAHLKKQGWTIVSEAPDAVTRAAHARIVRLEWGQGYPALRSDMSSVESRAVIAAASRAAGEPVAVMPMMGGSVPIYLFAEVLRTPIIGLPIVNHDNNQHAANENARLQNLWDGVETYAGLMSDLTW
jgi:acetylornithine deacetylase/succinyl-diaminopimelate desuccinylase-like protein